MERSALELSRVGGGSNHPWCSIPSKRGRTQRSLYPEGSPKKRCKTLKTNPFPGDTQPPGEKRGLSLYGDYQGAFSSFKIKSEIAASPGSFTKDENRHHNP